MKKIISIILSIVIICAGCGVLAFAKTSEEADTHLQFGKDGKFRIMQISDMQDRFPMKSITKNVIKRRSIHIPLTLLY